MNKTIDFQVCNDENDSEEGLPTTEDNIPFVVIDSIKANQEYRDLLQTLGIEMLDNSHAMKLIEVGINDYYKRQTLKPLNHK